MKTFILKKVNKLKENKKLLESKLKIKISMKGKQITINGEEISEFIASKIIEALELGFPIDECLTLLEPDFIFEKIEIKNLTKRHNLGEVRARVIGTRGRTKELIEELSECFICVHGNLVGVIGPSEKIRVCMQAVIKLIQGSKQSSVYSYLEKQRKVHHPEDLGLKIQEE